MKKYIDNKRKFGGRMMKINVVLQAVDDLVAESVPVRLRRVGGG